MQIKRLKILVILNAKKETVQQEISYIVNSKAKQNSQFRKQFISMLKLQNHLTM